MPCFCVPLLECSYLQTYTEDYGMHICLSGLEEYTKPQAPNPAWLCLIVQNPCLRFSPWARKLINDDNPMCSHILGSLHSVLKSQKSQDHKWIKRVVEFQASCHGSCEDYFWTGSPFSIPQSVLRRQLPSPLISLWCFKWWRWKKDELAPLREGDNTVKYIFRFSSVDMVNLASEVSWTVGKEDACLLLVKSISEELKHEQN